jgi:hypothetical protein
MALVGLVGSRQDRRATASRADFHSPTTRMRLPRVPFSRLPLVVPASEQEGGHRRHHSDRQPDRPLLHGDSEGLTEALLIFLTVP